MVVCENHQQFHSVLSLWFEPTDADSKSGKHPPANQEGLHCITAKNISIAYSILTIDMQYECSCISDLHATLHQLSKC